VSNSQADHPVQHHQSNGVADERLKDAEIRHGRGRYRTNHSVVVPHDLEQPGSAPNPLYFAIMIATPGDSNREARTRIADAIVTAVERWPDAYSVMTVPSIAIYF
jgi:hypothetical protein